LLDSLSLGERSGGNLLGGFGRLIRIQTISHMHSRECKEQKTKKVG